MTKIGPGKLPGLFAGITSTMLGGFRPSDHEPVSDYELTVRRQWEKIRQLFIMYGLNLSSDKEVEAATGLSVHAMMQHNLPQGFRHEYDTADILQYTPKIFIEGAQENNTAGTVTAIKRAFDGGGWVITVAFWNLSFNIPDQLVDYGDEATVTVKSNMGLEYRLRLCTFSGGYLSQDRLQDRIAKRQMSPHILGTLD